MGTVLNKRVTFFDTICQQSISISLGLRYNCHTCRVASVALCNTAYFEAKRLALALLSLVHYFGDITYCLIRGY